MDFCINNAHIAHWLKEYLNDMIDNNLRFHCLSLHNYKSIEIRKEIVSLMINELGETGKIIDSNYNSMLIMYNGFYFSINMENSISKTCNIFEFDIICFRELAEAVKDFKSLLILKQF